MLNQLVTMLMTLMQTPIVNFLMMPILNWIEIQHTILEIKSIKMNVVKKEYHQTHKSFLLLKVNGMEVDVIF
jgi:hypothetical protein